MQDELDAAEHVIKSKAEIRQVLIDCDTTNSRGANRLFGTGKPNPGPNGKVGSIYTFIYFHMTTTAKHPTEISFHLFGCLDTSYFISLDSHHPDSRAGQPATATT